MLLTHISFDADERCTQGERWALSDARPLGYLESLGLIRDAGEAYSLNALLTRDRSCRDANICRVFGSYPGRPCRIKEVDIVGPVIEHDY
jgi:hypothetical protein